MVAVPHGSAPQNEADSDTTPDLSTDLAVTENTRLLGALAGVDSDEATREHHGLGHWDNLADFEGLPWWQRPSVYWLLVPYSLFTLAFGSVIVPKLNLIIDLVCQRYFANQALQHPDQLRHTIILGDEDPQCRNPEIQKLVATFMLIMNFCTGILSAFVAPRLGHLSDRYGRRRLLALASAGGLLGELITILAAKFPETVDYRWLLLGSICDGITGSFTAGNILTQSYTSDCTPPSRRAVAIGYIHACLFTGLALGQFLGGEIVKLTGSLVSIFYICLGAHLMFIISVGFVIPESLSKRKQLVARERHAKQQRERRQRQVSWLSTAREKNPFAALSVLWPTQRGTSTRLRINLVALAACDMIIMGCAIAASQIVILYAGYVFGWKTPETSRLIAGISGIRVLVLMGIFPVINYYFRVRPAAKRRQLGIVSADHDGGADHLDLWILRFALLSDILGYVGYTLAKSPHLFVASAVVTAFGGLGSATSQSVVTKHIPPDRVGRVLGAIGMLQALVRVAAPVLFNGLYALTVETYPEAIFLVLTGLFAFAFACSLVVTPFIHWKEEVEEERQPPNVNDPLPDPFGTNVASLPLDEDEIRY